MNDWKTLTQKTVYDNPWIEVSHRDVITPGGTQGIYGKVHFKNIAVAVLPVDEEGYTWLVGQYRYTIDRYSWEIPEGGCPLGTDPLEAAKRELLEETGITAQRYTRLYDSYTSNSVTDEYAVAYLAQGLTFGEAQPEPSENLQVKRVPLAEAIAMVHRGEITDMFSMLTLLKAQAAGLVR